MEEVWKETKSEGKQRRMEERRKEKTRQERKRGMSKLESWKGRKLARDDGEKEGLRGLNE